jgi:hypothetical protein
VKTSRGGGGLRKVKGEMIMIYDKDGLFKDKTKDRLILDKTKIEQDREKEEGKHGCN